MRRASSTALSHLYSRTRPSFPLISNDFKTHLSSITTTINDDHHNHHRRRYSTQNRLNSCSDPYQFQGFSTLADQQGHPPPISSKQNKISDKSELEEAFESADAADDMIKAFKDMEASFDETKLGLASLKIGLKLDQEGEDPEQALSFAHRALKVLDREGNKSSLPLAMTLQLLGSACFSLKRFDDSLGYLNRASRILNELEEDGSCSVEDIRPILHAVQLELANTKTAMGRREEALDNLMNCLELKENILDKNCRELGDANRDLAEAHVAILNFKEPLPFCLKALEIHKSELGVNSVEVVHDRRLLEVIYTGLEEHEKALEQNQLSQKVLKRLGLTSDLLKAEIDAANIQIALGKYEEAIDTLKGAVQHIDKESDDRALVFISMAKALGSQEKFADSKRCLEIACAILDKRETTSPVEVAEAYMEVSMQYESMNEFETAIKFLKRTQSMLQKLPEEQHSEGSVTARIGWLLLLTGKAKEAIPYLESAAKRLKECFGTKHFGMGYIYNNLGTAYLDQDRPQSAAEMFAVAKEIMDVSLGPDNVDTIESCQNLSKAYGAMKSYPLAIQFQEQVVQAWEGHGPSAADELKEARRLLEQLKTKALGASPNEPPVKALPLPQNSRASRTSS